MLVVAIDTGGTFTDLAAYDTATAQVVYSKSLTTYADFADGAFDCVAKAGVSLAEAGYFKHGTTLVINALIQRAGARTALVCTRGFRDVLELSRGNRPEPFNLFFQRHPVLVPRELRFEVSERVNGRGEELAAPARSEVVELAAQLKASKVEAVGVAFLNSYLAEDHERQVAEWLRELLPGVFVTYSVELSREWYEFERSATVAANAYVGPQVAGYVDRLDRRLRKSGFGGKFFMMESNGGVLGVEQAVTSPVAMVESGPVGGSIGAGAYAEALGIANAITFDMGGTTAKCALIQDGRFDVKSVYWVGGYERGFPIRGAVIDVVEVGAGGGSIAWLDSQNRLHVGPRSAGSAPGPVCYRRGGTEPTVTDANVVLGRILPESFLGGSMALDVAGAERALRERIATPLGYRGDDGLREVADGIVRIASVAMAGAIKRITVERGHDPREFCMFAFGGGGPLHASHIARELHIPLVIVPPEAGNFSALGMLLASVRRDEGKTFIRDLSDDAMPELASVFEEMERAMSVRLRADVAEGPIRFEHSLEVRYRGQAHSVLTPIDGLATAAQVREAFERIYLARYGHVDRKNPVLIVNVRLVGFGGVEKPLLERLAKTGTAAPRERYTDAYFSAASGLARTRVLTRTELPAGYAAAGPALIEEYGSTTVVGPGERFEIGRLGEIRIDLSD